MYLKKNLISIALSLSILPAANAASITVDGKLSDWGLQRNGNNSDWTPDTSLGLLLMAN